MYHTWIYQCNQCQDEVDVDAGYGAGKCSCGGTYQKSGESYDQEFVDQERYYQEQDREYEDRHRHDYY